MNLKIKGTLKPQTIFFVKFSALGLEQNKCTSSGTYLKDAEKFASQFKKVLNFEVTMEIISYHGNEYKN